MGRLVNNIDLLAPSALTPGEFRHPQRRLRICFVSRAMPLHRLGGLEHHAQDLANALGRRGHCVFVLSTQLPPGKTGQPVEGGGHPDTATKTTAFTPETRPEDEYTLLIIPGTVAGNYSVTFYRRASKVLEALHGQENFDVVIPIDLAGLFINPANFNVPVIPLIHGTLTSEVPLDWRYWQNLGMADKARVLWRYKTRLALLPVFRRMIRRADAIMVDSEFTRRELMLEVSGRETGSDGLSPGRDAARIARKCLVVPLGIDPDRYPAAAYYAGRSALEGPVQGGEEADSSVGPGMKPLRLAILGRLQQVKGIEMALRAAAQLKKRGVEFRLDIGGTGDFGERAQQLAIDLGLNEQVRFKGRIPPGELAEFLHNQDLLLFPDLTQPAFGLVAVEAFLHNLPVVAARAGAIPEVVTEDCGWLYEQWDVAGLANLLAVLAKDRRIIAEKARNARNRAGCYTAEQMGERAEAALYTALNAQEKFATGTGK